MANRWTEDLSVGVTEIDSQHKELFGRSEILMDAITRGRGKEELARLVSFLEVYIVTHFALEEQYMKKLNYPDYASHREEHRNFILTVFDLRAKVQERVDDALVLQSKDILVDWLNRHIMIVDKKLGIFLKERLAAQPYDEAISLVTVNTEQRYRSGQYDQ